MADSVAKIRIDSKEADANIKHTGQALADYFRKVREGDGTFAKLDEGVMEAIKAIREMGTKADSTRGALRELTQATTDLTAAYRSLDNEALQSDTGKELSKTIEILTQRAGEAKDAMGDVSAAITSSASDTRGLDRIAGGITLMTSGFQTAVGAANLLGMKIGNQEKVLTKLASAMSITSGLLTVLNLLQSQSTLMMGVQASKAALATAAQKALAAATGSATIAQKAFNVVAKANPYVLLASAVAAVGGALIAFSKSAKEATEEEKEMAKATERLKNIQESYSSSVATSIGNAMGAYERLRAEYSLLQTEAQKVDFMKNHKKDFDQLGLSIDNITQLESTFTGNTSSVVKAFEDRAKAAAAVQAIQSLYADYFNKVNEYENDFKNKQVAWELPGTKNLTMPQEWQDAGLKLHIDYEKDMEETAYGLVASYRLLDSGRQKLIDAYGNSLQQDLDKNLKRYRDVLQNTSSMPITPTTGTGTTRSATKPAVDVTESLTELQLLQDELKTVENSMKPFGKTSDEWKTMNTYAEELRQRIKDINGETPQLVKGLSINSNTGLSEYIGMLREQLQNADLGSELYTALSAQLADTTTLQNLVGEALKVGLGTALFDVADETGADFWTRAMEGGVKNIDWQAIVDQINEARKAAGLDAISLDFKTGSVSTDGKKNPYLNRNDEGKMELKMTDALGGMASGIQNMADGLEQLGIDIPQGLSDVVSGIQSVTNILSGIMSIVSVIQAIAGADAIIPFAGGGIVPHFAGGGLIGKAALGMTIPGHSYSGDLLRLPVDGGRGMIGVNSGEVIMNQAQAGILESELSGGRMRDINVHGVLQGENIVLAVSNYFRRTGKGEAAMWGKN